MFSFDPAVLLEYSHNKEFFGANFNFRCTKNLTVQGRVETLNNNEGVHGIWTGISGIVNDSNDYEDIVLNGVNFGKGKINSINFSEGNDVHIKNYTVSLTVFETGDLSNLDTSSKIYSGIATGEFFNIDSLTEQFNYNVQNNVEGYTHSLSLRLISGYGSSDPKTKAKTIAANLLASNDITGFIGTGYKKTAVKKYKESYNLISNECSFEENVEFVTGSQNYSLQNNLSFTLGQDGNISVSENGVIQGLIDPISGSAYNGYTTEKPLIFGRCSSLFNDYAPANCYPLSSYPIENQLDFNTFEGTINYRQSYSNSPRLSGTFSWSYTNQLDKNEDGVFTASENGTVKGHGIRGVDLFSNALVGWQAISGGISGRCSDRYQGAGTLVKFAEGFSRSEFMGEIGYEQKYTDDISAIDVSGIRKYVCNVTKDLPTRMVNKFNIFNYKEIAQDAGISNLCKVNVEVNLMGARGTSYGIYKDFAIEKIKEFVPASSGNYFVSDMSYKYSPVQNNFSASASLIYQTGHLLTDTTAFSGMGT